MNKKLKIGIYIFMIYFALVIMFALITSTKVNTNSCNLSISNPNNLSVKENLNFTFKGDCPPFYKQYTNLSINLSQRE